MPALFDPLIIKISVSGTASQYHPCASIQLWMVSPTTGTSVRFGSRAAGGAGLLIQEATAVSPEGRITPDCPRFVERRTHDHAKTHRYIHRIAGAVPGIQLAHAGRKASHSSPWMGAKPLLPEEGHGKPYRPRRYRIKTAILFRMPCQPLIYTNASAILKPRPPGRWHVAIKY